MLISNDTFMDSMGVDLVPRVDTFQIRRNQNFPKVGGDHSVEDGCIGEGQHRVLRFNLYTINIGDKDLVIGNPKDRLDLFDPHPNVHPSSDWIFKEKFYFMTLSNNSGIERSGWKKPFCLTDQVVFTSCDNQGIAKNGRRDMYDAGTSCNLIDIGDLPDGIYTFKVTTNYTSVIAYDEKKGRVLIEEDNYKNNTISVPLEIRGILVTTLSEVVINDNSYSPPNLSITRGQTVHWTNSGSAHTVTSNPGTRGCSPSSTESFASPVLTSGQTFDHTFNTPGTFAYHCEVHGCTMAGTVTVT